jgi:hypothetical protein
MDATCTPVAPAPMTSIEAGTEVMPHTSLCVAVNSKPGIGRLRLVPPALKMILSAVNRRPLSVSMLAHVMNHSAHASQQARIIKDRLADRNAELSQLAGLPQQASCLG